MSWSPEIDWETPSGAALRKLFAAFPPDRAYTFTLFGSSPLQLTVERALLSRDVDLLVEDWESVGAEVQSYIEAAGLAEHQHPPVYVQLCPDGNFRTSPRWALRAFVLEIGLAKLIVPHPIDILIAKLHRLEEKDLRAFRLVLGKLGIPTEAQLKAELRAAVDLFRPNFDEEAGGDLTANTRVLWQELWGKEIDVRREIIAPALEARRQGFEPDRAKRDYRGELRRLSE